MVRCPTPQETRDAEQEEHAHHPDGGWQAKREGASVLTPTQAEAEAAAKEILGNSGGGEVLIHGRDGKIRDKDTVALGSLELVDAVLGHGKGPALSQQFVQVDTVFRGAVAQSGE